MLPLRLFLSYAHEDESYKDALTTHLSGLRGSGLIDDWNDRALLPGEEWDAGIRKNLEEADIAVFLISAHFMASTYINEVEVKSALEKHEAGSLTIVPVLIRHCDFSSFQALNGFQALPQNGKPVKAFEDMDEAWMQVINGLKEIISVVDKNIELKSIPSPDPTVEAPNPAAPSKVLGDYHKYSCDRIDQSDLFNEVLDAHKEEHTFFFFMYGLDMQSHLGLFNRFAYELEGYLQDFVNPGLRKGQEPETVIITFKASNNEEGFKRNIICGLLNAFKISPDEHQPLSSKTLDLIIQESPLIKRRSKDDYISVFISIDEDKWDKEKTPAMTKWFITHFCKTTITDCPTFLFFFGVIYDEGDDIIRKEVQETVENSDFITVLPELNMVPAAHLESWFAQYLSLLRTRARKELLNSCKTNLEKYCEDGAYFMEDVEIELAKAVDQINEKYIE